MTAPLSACYQVFATLEYATALVCTHVSASRQICTSQLPDIRQVPMIELRVSQGCMTFIDVVCPPLLAEQRVCL